MCLGWGGRTLLRSSQVAQRI
uniref:Uncharacterized protein n=1 Tax=Anguilla anguilla TaxID=7936 RepID=A0A0E9QI64_ANGAN